MIITRWIKVDSPLYKKINGLIKSFDKIFLIRPIMFLLIWTFISAGMSAYYGTKISEFYWSINFNLNFFLIFFAITLISSSATLVDLKGSFQRIVMILLISGILVLITGLLLESKVSMTKNQIFPVGAWILAFYSTWRGFLKNQKTLLQEKISLRIFFSGFSSLSLFMTGWHIGGGSVFHGLFSSLPYIIVFIAVFLYYPLSIHAEKLHYRDLMTDLSSIPIISFILLIISTVIAYFINDPVLSTAGAIITPFYLVSLIFPRAEHILRSFKYPLFILAIFIGVRLPWLLFALFFNFTLIRLYNYFRFGIIEPTLKVSND
tara:strand:- start:663 stop:1619 length:957 start_codon:yes stop_codon:yes gene_type:complete